MTFTIEQVTEALTKAGNPMLAGWVARTLEASREGAPQQDWIAIAEIATSIRRTLDGKPKELRIGTRPLPGSILNAYREGDLNFEECIAELEKWRSDRPGVQPPSGPLITPDFEFLANRIVKRTLASHRLIGESLAKELEVLFKGWVENKDADLHAELTRLNDWKESAMQQLAKSDRLKEIVGPKYLGWDVYAAAEKEFTDLRAQNETWKRVCLQAQNSAIELSGKLFQSLEALRKYGQHQVVGGERCLRTPCTCGFEAAAASVQPASTPDFELLANGIIARTLASHRLVGESLARELEALFKVWTGRAQPAAPTWPEIPPHVTEPLVFEDKNLGICLLARQGADQWVYRIHNGQWCSLRKVDASDPIFVTPLNKAADGGTQLKSFQKGGAN